jgi:hypothetical protein
MKIEDFWTPFETEIDSFDKLVKVINKISDKSRKKNTRFAWRGLSDASWALHSSLYRRLALTKGKNLDEAELYKEEHRILVNLHQWGLHSPIREGRLSVMNQLAMLQHYGAPTRLIDITFNAWIGCWFAVEEKWHNGEKVFEDKDARLFAIDVTDRLINENGDYRCWEDDLHTPWGDSSSSKIELKNWRSSVFAWKPPSLDARIAAQNGAFIFGGVAGSPFQFPKGGVGNWNLDEGRTACCLALRPHKFETFRGGASSGALYTFRIKSDVKVEIRERLEKVFGYTHSTIYPDFTGFSNFATPHLKTNP